MNAELKELAEKAGFDLEFGHVLALASHEEVAEFAALIAERCARIAQDENCGVPCPYRRELDRGYDVAAINVGRVLRDQAARWRSVIPSTPEKEQQ